MKVSPHQVIQLLAQRDKRAISILYDQYGPALYGIIIKIVKSESIAQDVLQDSFIKIWKNGPNYDPKKGTLFTWMLNISRNTAIDKTRSSYYRRTQNSESINHNVSNNINWSIVPKTEHIGLKKVISNLDEKYKIIIELIYFRGLSQQEVHEQLNIPLGTVKSRLRIGLRELRKVFDIQNISIIVLLLFS